jgi:cyclomaltodextrinase / maltogenic alpha-amylase / neopullulanase
MYLVMNMNKGALFHQAKSEFSYAYDEKTLHLTFRTAKNDVDEVYLIYGDPFEWTGKKPNIKWSHHVKKIEKRYQQSTFDYYFASVSPSFLRCKYIFVIKKDDRYVAYGSRRIFEVEDLDGFYETFNLADFFNFPYINAVDLHHTPEWVKDTIWYQIFPDRFYKDGSTSELTWGSLPVSNQEIYGGTLKGVIKKLNYLKDLGITGIYFTPIFESPTAHKYDTIDYYQIDPQFGTNDDFKALTKKAHELGIKVMLDGVFNHSGYYHPYFLDVVKHGEKSMYKNCFFIKNYPVVNFEFDDRGLPKKQANQRLHFETFAFTPMMPKWNTADPLAEKHLLGCISYWIESCDIDGWRLDVSNEVSHDFLRKIKKTSREAKKDTFILGENWDSSMPWLHGDQLDSVMNYELSYPIWQYLEHKISLPTFIDLVVNYVALTPKNVMENMFNLVGSHDTIRIKKRLNDDPRRTKLAFLLMFLSAGAPNIYYGDEVGLTGQHDPDNRRCMLWDEKDHDLDFFQFVKTLITLRKSSSAMKDYDYHFIHDDHLLIFEKKSKTEHLLVLINNHDQTHACGVSNFIQGTYINLMNTSKVNLCDKISIEPYGFMLLQRM